MNAQHRDPTPANRDPVVICEGGRPRELKEGESVTAQVCDEKGESKTVRITVRNGAIVKE